MDSHTSIISFLLLFFLSSMAVATPDMSREKRFLMGFGAFWPNIDSEAHLDSKDLGTGTDIDFESDLGLKDTDTLFTVFMAARISKRWRGEFEWFQLNRKKRTVIDEQIKWGDEVFDIGADIKSEFNLDLYRIGLNYSIVRKPRTVAGIGFGAHVTRFDAKLKAIGTGVISGSISSEGGNVTAPLPNVGVNLRQKFSSKLDGMIRLDYFKISLGDYDGSLISSGLNLLYHLNDTWGLNAGYRLFKLNANIDAGSWQGSIDYAYHGPVAMIYAQF